MAKNPGRSGAPSTKKKARHTPAQKKEAAKARAARATQIKRVEREERKKSTRDDRGERSYNRRDDDSRPYSSRDDKRDDRRSYGSRDDRGARGERSYNRREDDRRSYGSRDDRRPYGSRDDNRDDRRSHGSRDDNRDNRRPYGSRDDNRDDRRSHGSRDDNRDNRRPYGSRDDSRDDRRSHGSRDDRGARGERSYNRREDDRRPYSSRDDKRDDRRPYGSRDDRRSYDRKDDRSFQRRDPEIVAPSRVDRPGPGDASAFAELGVDSRLVEVLGRAGITAPFPIQAAAIPDALAGRDVLGRGRTGSGKTLAFGLPLIQRLAQGGQAKPHRPRALVLAPTRELAMQVIDALRPHLRAVGLNLQLVAGGMSYTPQLAALENGVDVLVATPGRLIDLIERGAADLSEVQVTVLDEADHMSQLGFLEAITQILDTTPSDSQRLLFSATLDHGVGDVADKYLTDPVTHSTDDATASVTTMDHHIFLVHPHDKREMTATITNRQGRTVVFARTKLGADRVATQLREAGVFAAALHGGLNQAARSRVMEAFRGGELPVLVATDVAARGIHVDDVSLVLHVDPPADHKDYLHRSGRTARAGESGVVVTLALPHQRRKVANLLSQAGVDVVPQEVKPGDRAVTEQAGGSTPSYDAIPQARLDDLLSPRRRTGGPRRPGHFRGRDQGRRYGHGDRAGAGHPHRGRRPNRDAYAGPKRHDG